MKAYKKLIVAVVGVAVMLLARHTGLDLTDQAAMIVDVVIGALTAAGVYQFENETAA